MQVSCRLTLFCPAILGFIADKGPSRKTPFVVSLLALAVATALFWAAKSPVELVVARCLQSLSGGAVWIVGNALILDTVGKDQAGTAMGYVSMALTVGSLAGPALGGVLYVRCRAGPRVGSILMRSALQVALGRV